MKQPKDMTSGNGKEILNPYYVTCLEDEKAYWKALKAELLIIRDKMKVSHEELAIGLKISRQVVIDFLSDEPSRADLPIYRSNLIALWRYITSPNTIQTRQDKPQVRGSAKARLSEQHIEERRKWEKEGCDRLLESAGFRSTSKELESGTSFKGLKRSHRIVSRLSSNWLTDGDSWKVQEASLNAISELKSLCSDNNSESIIPLSHVPQWFSEIYEGDYTDSSQESKSKSKFLSILSRYARLGKSEFSPLELFELYQSILENDYLREGSIKKLKIRILDCEFKNLDQYYNELETQFSNSSLLRRMIVIGYLIEQGLSDFEEDSRLSTQFLEHEISFNPMREAKITCRIGDDPKNRVNWWYRSSSTHTENLLLALKRGMGHSLEVTNLSQKGLSEGASGLARVSGMLRDTKTNALYQGVWVDIDMLVAFIQSVTVAIEKWFDHQQISLQTYENSCSKIAHLFSELEMARRALHEYKLFIMDSSRDNFNEFFKDKTVLEIVASIIEEIDNLYTNIPESESDYVKILFDKNLQYIKEFSIFLQLRNYHIKGEILKVKKVLELKKEESLFYEAPLLILFIVEEIFQKFFSGDNKFIYGRLWRNQKEYTIEYFKHLLKIHIVENKNEKINQVIYQTLAEAYGNIARLELYFCDEDEKSILEEAVEQFMAAAYFSMKTDNPHRIAHWLAQASRACTRLYKIEDSNNFIKMASLVISASLSSRDYYEYQFAVRTEVNLARGELYLARHEYETAFKCFQDALIGALSLGFARLIVDSIYGISKSACALHQILEQEDKNDDYLISNFNLELSKALKSYSTQENRYPPKIFQPDLEISEINSMNSEIIALVYTLINDQIKSDGSERQFIQWELLSQKSSDCAIEIWQLWSRAIHGPNKSHPIKDLIKTGAFLKIIY